MSKFPPQVLQCLIEHDWAFGNPVSEKHVCKGLFNQSVSHIFSNEMKIVSADIPQKGKTFLMIEDANMISEFFE